MGGRKLYAQIFFFNELFGMFLHMHILYAAASQSLTLTARSLLFNHLYICSSLSEFDNACHTNKMVVYHKVALSPGPLPRKGPGDEANHKASRLWLIRCLVAIHFSMVMRY